MLFTTRSKTTYAGVVHVHFQENDVLVLRLIGQLLQQQWELKLQSTTRYTQLFNGTKLPGSKTTHWKWKCRNVKDVHREVLLLRAKKEQYLFTAQQLLMTQVLPQLHYLHVKHTHTHDLRQTLGQSVYRAHTMMLWSPPPPTYLHFPLGCYRTLPIEKKRGVD